LEGNPENILEGWKKHFETLATPAENDTKDYTNTEFDLDLIYEICTDMAFMISSIFIFLWRAISRLWAPLSFALVLFF
jgi:hypothetical protein